MLKMLHTFIAGMLLGSVHLLRRVFMDVSKFADRMSFIVAFIALVFGFILFFSDTLEFMKSLAAAILLATLVWVSYIMIRWLVLALRK